MVGAPEGSTSKLAIYSHILPPSPSGQATVLARLLRDWDPTSVRLIQSQAGGRGFRVRPSPPLMATPSHSIATEASTQLHRRPFAERLSRALMYRTPLAVSMMWGRARELAAYLHAEGCTSVVVCTGGFWDMLEGFLAGRWAHIPVIAYYFDWYGMQWPTPLRRSLALGLEALLIRRFAAVIVPNQALSEALAHRYSVQTIVIPNPCGEQALSQTPEVGWPACAPEISIAYTGAIYHANLDALRNLALAISTPDLANMRLHVYTSQPQSVLRDQDIKADVVFHAHLPPESICEVQRRADVLYLPLAFESPITEVIHTSAPGKMGDYLATGRPILVHAPTESFVSRYFREHNCGVVVDSNSPNAVAEALKRIATDSSLRQVIGENARESARADFDPALARQTLRRLVDHIEVC